MHSTSLTVSQYLLLILVNCFAPVSSLRQSKNHDKSGTCNLTMLREREKAYYNELFCPSELSHLRKSNNYGNSGLCRFAIAY